jgi:arsenite methyltransferase
MTSEMLELARRNADDAGAKNVEFLFGRIESIPLSNDSIDVVISNCVVNLSPDKRQVFREMYRVLRPGGRIGITDIVTVDELTEADRLERGSYVGCIAGALRRTEYERGLRAAGFCEVSIVYTHAVGDGVQSAIIRAIKPAN